MKNLNNDKSMQNNLEKTVFDNLPTAEEAERMEADGCTILDRNYRSRYGEIDIIASDGKYLIFAEVRARKIGAPVSAIYSVTRSKIHKICKTAMNKHSFFSPH